MLSLLVIALLGGGAYGSINAPYYSPELAEGYFSDFMVNFNKSYSSPAEFEDRFQVFKDNLERANEMNRNSPSAEFGITQFMDLTKDEFHQHTSCLKTGLSSNLCQQGEEPHTKGQAPDSFDWRDHKVVTRVKHQEKCGSCWAFSSIGNIEADYALKYGQLQEISVQQLVDCTEDCSGCGGGIMSSAFSGIIEKGGLQSDQDYPYTAKNGTCTYDSSRAKVKLTGCKTYNFKSQQYDKVKDLLHQIGPISVGLQSGALQAYHGGILDAQTCNQGKLDHAVLLVGYGTEGGKPYWTLKNSWGASWGEQGYFRIERSQANACNMINSVMSTASVA